MVDKINQQEIEIYDGIGAGYLFFVLFLYFFFFTIGRQETRLQIQVSW